MPSSPSDLLTLARKGDPQAIAALMNKTFSAQGFSAQVLNQDGCLKIQVQGNQPPNQPKTVGFITNGLKKLDIPGINAVQIFGKQSGSNQPAWGQRIALKQTQRIAITDSKKQDLDQRKLRAAQQGDTSALSELIQQSLGQDVTVEVGKYFKFALYLKLRSQTKIDPKQATEAIARLLNRCKPEKVAFVWMTGFFQEAKDSWNKVLMLRQGRFVDTTELTHAAVIGGLGGTAILYLVVASFTGQFLPTESSSSSPDTSSRTFLGTGPTGYELWADESCVYVKGLTQADLARLNGTVWSYKEAVKAETGYSCVIFE